MPYESTSWVFKATDRVAESVEHVTDAVGRVVDSEYTLPLRTVAFGALVGFAVGAASIEAGRTLLEAAHGNEQFYIPDSK